MTRRPSARKAKLKERKAAIADDLKPVRAGQTGGQYRPLSAADANTIIETAYQILEEVGFADATEHCIETCKKVGAEYGEDGRLRFPRQAIADTLSNCQKNLTLYAQDPRHDLDLSGSRVHFSTAGAAVMVFDPVTAEYRESTGQDLYDMARITNRCEHLHMFQRTCVARDIADNREMDINTTYNCMMGTAKHIGCAWNDPAHLAECFEMLHMVAGSEEEWRARPFMSISCCHVVPPMKFTEDALNCLKLAVEGGFYYPLGSQAQLRPPVWRAQLPKPGRSASAVLPTLMRLNRALLQFSVHGHLCLI